MAIGVIFNGPGVTEAQYQQVFNRVSPNREMPRGMLYHAAGPSEGGWCVVEMWDTQESLERFVQERLAAALEEAHITGATTTFQVRNEVKS